MTYILIGGFYIFALLVAMLAWKRAVRPPPTPDKCAHVDDGVFCDYNGDSKYKNMEV